jgi:hypothetical protein
MVGGGVDDDSPPVATLEEKSGVVFSIVLHSQIHEGGVDTRDPIHQPINDSVFPHCENAEKLYFGPVVSGYKSKSDNWLLISASSES